MHDYFRSIGVTPIPLGFQFESAGEGLPMMTEAAAAADSVTRSGLDDLVPDSRWPNHHRVHRFVPAVELLQASRYRTMLIQQMHEALQGLDPYVEITWSTKVPRGRQCQIRGRRPWGKPATPVPVR